MALEEQEGTGITRKGDPHPKVTPPSFKMVASGRQCTSRPTITPPQSCSANFYRRIKRRVGRSLRGVHCKGNLVPSRKQVTHKLSGTKGSLSGPERFLRPLLEPNSAHSHRQHHSGCLCKQGRRHEIGPSVYPTVENPDLVLRETGDSQSQTQM